MTPDIQALIAEAKRLHGLATEGPWRSVPNWACPGELKGAFIYSPDCQIGDVSAVKPKSQSVCDANAQFIAHSRTAIPALVAEVERLSALVERVEEIARQAYMDGIDLERLCPNDAENQWEKSCTWNNLQMSKEGHAWQVVE